LRTTPQQTVQINGLDSSGQLLHRSLVIPGLDIKGDSGLGDGLGLVGLLGSVLSKTLLLELLGLFINLLIIRSEEIDIIVFLSSSGSRGGSSSPKTNMLMSITGSQ
jgi:hypothetical protein